MAGKTVTLVMHGDVPLETFAEGVVQFQNLMRALSREIGDGAAIRWTRADLDVGDADMSFVGEAEAPEIVEGVARAFFTVGQALASEKPIPYRQEVAIPARALSALVGDRVTSIEFAPMMNTPPFLPPPRSSLLARTGPYRARWRPYRCAAGCASHSTTISSTVPYAVAYASTRRS